MIRTNPSAKPAKIPVYEAVDNRVERSLIDEFRYIRSYYPFFVYWVRRNLVARYSQTSVGFLWAILQPLLTSLVYVLVFSLVLRIPTGDVPYPLFIVTMIVLWTYFNRIVFSGGASIITNLDIITRIRFPRELLPLGIAVESLVDLLFGFIIVGFLYIIYRQPLSPYMLIGFGVFVVHTILALGLAYFFASLTSVFRDLTQILPVLLQLLLYLSPVIYPLTNVPDHLRTIYFLNPLAPIFAAYQETLFYHTFTLLPEMAYATVVSVIVLFFGYRTFRAAQWRFADAL